jgi:two-component system, chemotaxis family, chemotaxis protein CheY
MTKIFLLDDEEINDIIFSSIIEDEQNIHYHYESDGWKALQYLHHKQMERDFPEILFVDLNMSHMDGFTFVEYYEKKYFELFPNTRLFILTSSILNRDKDKALQYPSVISFIPKPITKAKLLNIVDQFQMVD